MLKKINYIVGFFTLIVAFAVLLKTFGLISLPDIFEYWTILIALTGLINIIVNWKVTVDNIFIILIGISLFGIKIGLLF